MAQNTTLNSVTYSIPDPGDSGWGASLTSFLVAIAPAVLQKSGGTFTLTSDADFGASFGLKSIYFSSRAANPSSAGLVRLSHSDTIGFRNFANSGNLLLSVDNSDTLLFNGSPVGLFTGTANRAVQTDGSGLLTVSAVTSTELGYLSGVTSAVQPQLNAKKSVATGNNFKFETTDGSGNLQETTVTPSRAVATDSNGLPTAATTTAAELDFVSGATSSIQTQLNGKASTALSNLSSTSVNTDINMNSHKLTSLSAGTTSGDSVRYEQIAGTASAAALTLTDGANNAFTGVTTTWFYTPFNATHNKLVVSGSATSNGAATGARLRVSGFGFTVDTGDVLYGGGIVCTTGGADPRILTVDSVPVSSSVVSLSRANGAAWATATSYSFFFDILIPI